MTTYSMASNRRFLRHFLITLIFITSFSPAFSFKDFPGMHNNQAHLLLVEYNRFSEIQKKGGWKKITSIKKTYQKGVSALVIKQIKERLYVSGDYNPGDTSTLFTPELADAVKRSQRRFGFKENGIVDGELIKELNVPVQKRMEQLLVNIERFKTRDTLFEGTRLIANIPEFKLHVYEGSKLVWDMAIVVGKEGHETVIFNDTIKHIVFSPYWNVPPSIVKNEILPAMKKSRDYLSRNDFIQTGTENSLPVIRQLPGNKNALGKVKFVFPNSHNIYFHDTQAKGLFSLRKRAFSHGCIRLAEPAKLAAYLLKENPEWTTEKINRALNANKEQWVSIKTPAAVSITYFTAWIDAAGLLHFREDIYGHDKEGAQSLLSSKNN